MQVTYFPDIKEKQPIKTATKERQNTVPKELVRFLNISDNQLSYITNVPAGRGLMKCGSTIVPFEDSFPKQTKL